MTAFWTSSGPLARAGRASLLPLAGAWELATGLRRHAYQAGWLTAARLPLPAVAVGNLAVGGAGKTPLAAWVAAWYGTRGIRAGVLLRGYGGDEAAVHREAAPFAIVVEDPDRREQATLDQSWDASLTAMERLGFVVTQRDRTDVEARILAYTQGGREVRIRLSRDTTVLSRIRIRVGTFGDESLSRLILERIETHLPVKTAGVTPTQP